MLDILNDTNWQEAFGYAGEPDTCATKYQGGPVIQPSINSPNISTALFTREDVVEVIAISEGENDERPWLCAGLLKDGRWFFLEAGCDYTGWDCQAGGCALVATTRPELEKFCITEEQRTRLGITLKYEYKTEGD
jgi:hypothetical protein